MRRTVLLLGVLFFLCIGSTLYSEPAPTLRTPDWSQVSDFAAPPELRARAAILVDVASQTVLYAKNPDLVIPPASLTKLVAIDAALVALKRGEIAIDADIAPAPAWWAENQPPDSSLMFLGPGQRFDVEDLLLGLSVSSGNDAAVALAELVDGSVRAFAERMNRRVRELGLIDLSFEEPCGLSPRNTITARSFARFLLAHLEQHPEVLREYYSVRTFTYPAAEHRVGAQARAPITQANRNTLLWEYEGVDGFKTGFIDESGYHLAATAERDGRRLVAVVLGLDAESHAIGGALRAADAAALLDYGFEAFSTHRFGYPAPEAVRVFGGREPLVIPEGPTDIEISVPAGSLERLQGRIEQEDEVIAPTPRAEVGRVAIELEGIELASEVLVLPAQERAGVLRRLWDGTLVTVRRVGSWFADVELPVQGAELSPVAP
ncbi:MAG: D-alanyl-D-alanine carboxypeptidase family protein [Spirochaetota bacterium]